MTDLVKQLRDECEDATDPIFMTRATLLKAADRIEQLEAANLKASLIKVDDMARIEKLETAIDDLLQYVSRADWHYLKPETIQAMEDKAHD